MNLLSPTPHPEVNEILNLFRSKVKEILGDQLVGMYLFGSLANGDFDEHSDIDILVVTDGDISNDIFKALKQMHKGIQAVDSPWSNQMEVSYIPRDAIRRYDPKQDRHPHLDRGNGEDLHILQHSSDWTVQRHILRERGITLFGPEPRTLIDFVSPDQLRKAMYPILFEWYAHFLDMANPWDSRGYQSYAVLSLCRILYTLEKGEVVSKMTAARWAKENLEPRWIPLIDSAIFGRQHSNGSPLRENVDETKNMIRYAMQRSKPTPYSEVNELLNLLLRNVKAILSDQFVGMYLYGSLASGDFNPETSDIDFLVVTEESLPKEIISQLEAMHKATWAKSVKRAGKLEGSYVPKALIRRHDPGGVPCPTVNEGKFFVDQRGSDWIIQRHVVREYGVIVEGPDPETLIDYVSPEDIRGAVIGILKEWWYPMLEDPWWLQTHESGDRSFGVITMCRVLLALEYGTIVSKPKAVQWARAKLDDRWKALIDKAVAVSNHEELALTVDEVLDFIRFTKSAVESSGVPIGRSNAKSTS